MEKILIIHNGACAESLSYLSRTQLIYSIYMSYSAYENYSPPWKFHSFIDINKYIK